jgi:hypothetical protein
MTDQRCWTYAIARQSALKVIELLKKKNFLKKIFPQLYNKTLSENDIYLAFDLAQWSKYSPIAQKVADTMPAQYKRLCTWTCLFLLGRSVFYLWCTKSIYLESLQMMTFDWIIVSTD